MPPSSNQETQPTSIIGSLAQRQAQKQAASGVHTPTKKERKNGPAKDNGGVATLTKSNPKALDSTEQQSPSVSPKLNSTETTPVSAPTNGSSLTSPQPEPISSKAFTATAAQNTNEWARNVPAFSTSPGNLISLGDSPPAHPSSYEQRTTLSGWSQRERVNPNGFLPSTSPPTHQRRPLSFQMDSNLSFEDPALQRTPPAFRRSSMYSQQSQYYSVNPPPPHHPQAHFYSAPDPTFGLPSRESGLRTGLQGYYCGFDSLGLSKHGNTSKPTDNVILSGYEGGLDIYSISKSGLDKLVSIDGLRGGVYHAKILPWIVQPNQRKEWPLVAVVLHGPVVQLSQPPIDEYSRTAQASSETSSIPKGESTRSSPPEVPSSLPEHDFDNITHYQTTVEIYSLNTRANVATLLSAPKIPLTVPVTNPLFIRPPPVGALNISADAGTIVVASGTTGEVWIYHQNLQEKHPILSFRCIGKIWTTVHRPFRHDSASSGDFAESEPLFSETVSVRSPAKAALISLQGRWLAYCPSAPTSQISLKALVPSLVSVPRAPGMNSHTPPQLPIINCAVDMPDGETILDRLSRQAMQTSIQGAKWLGNQGVRAWNSYWGTPSTVPQQATQRFWQGQPRSQGEAGHNFPPTHGDDVPHSASNTDLGIISVLDIHRLASSRNNFSAVLHPLATFKAPLGCSFLSFAPSGLALFTASSKGDVQFVWDLMRIQYTKSSALQPQHLASLQGQHIRQIAVFTRLTAARIADVVWTAPHGEKIAIVTEKNTVHFLDLPPNTFAWPPARRRVKASPRVDQGLGDGSEHPSSATAMAANAVGAVWKSAQPFISRPRGFSGSSRPATLAASLTATAGQGTKAVAATISKSFGAATGTIDQFRKSGENRLHLPQGTTLPSHGCFKWLGGQNTSFAVLVEGVVRIYTMTQRPQRINGKRQRASVGRKYLDFKLPLLPDYKIAPIPSHRSEVDEELDLAEKESEEIPWDFEPSSSVMAGASPRTESSIPQAEIESNAPYQPFHTDRRVGLYVYSTPPLLTLSPSGSALLSPLRSTSQQQNLNADDAQWVFGRPVHSIQVDIGPAQSDGDEDFDSSSSHRDLPASSMERVTTKISEADEEIDQIVITTRRRRKSPRTITDVTVDEEGFFDDDCEVIDFASQRV